MPFWVLKYAQIDIGDNCTQQPGQLYTSERAQALPVVLQPEDLADTFRFVFTGFVVRQYMTRRPAVAFACRGVHEFVSFPFVHTDAVNTDLRVTYEVGIWDGPILLDFEQYEFEDAEQGIWELGVGEANLTVQALLIANPTADFWTVKVEMWRKTGSPGYYLAHTLTRRLGGECKCPDLELYYLEDFGSYRTLQLFRLEEQAQEQRAVTGKRDIDWLSGDRNSIFVRRGRSSKTVQANERLAYRTQVLPSKDDAGGIYAELLRCKQAYVKDGLQPTYIRSIAIERVEIVQLIAEEAQVFNITFRYNTDITIRP